MRLDRYLRNKLGQIPQSLIEKNIRNGKIKLNRKTKSSIKLDQMIKLNYLILNLEILIKLKKFKPNNIIIKQNEDLIIDNMIIF